MGVVTVGGKNLNQELVRAGMAWHYVRYAPKDKTLAKLEADARAALRGLWVDKAPIPPWDYRSGPQNARSPSEAATDGKVRSATVYATRTGSRYHRDGCSALARSRIPMRVKDAEARGLTPCHLCKP